VGFQYPPDCIPATARHDFDPISGWCIKCGAYRNPNLRDLDQLDLEYATNE
jgi:hypothetical protein